MRRVPTPEVEADPAVQRLIVETHERQSRGLTRREQFIEIPVTFAFVAAAIALPLLFPGHGDVDWPIAVALLSLYALADRVTFHMGAGWTVPTQLVLVPTLFLLPAALAPAFVAVALLVGRLPDCWKGSVRAERLMLDIGNAWYVVGPALILAAAGATTPQWSDWPIYLGALASQFALDCGWAMLRARDLGVETRNHLRELGSVYLVDLLLSPVGLLVAFVAASQGAWSFLAILPLLGVIALFAREREARIENALALSNAYRGTAHLLGEVLSSSHEYTAAHSRSVVLLSHQVGLELGVDEATMRDIEFGALLHDVGKIAVPDEILNKPARLSDSEWETMRGHTIEGQSMLDQIGGVLGDVGIVVRSHHERWDGTGYPDGLKGEEIPLPARVISACDAFNAMVTDRPYRSAMSTPAALEELRANAGVQFDPRVVEALIGVLEQPLEAGVPQLDERRRFQPKREAITLRS